MNEQDIKAELAAVTTMSEPLDPARVIAGAHRRRRRGVAAGVIASAGVTAAVAVGVLAGVGTGAGASDAPVATAPTPSVSTTPVSRHGYTFQNKRPAVGTLSAGAEVKIGAGLYFATRGTQWAVISRQPGESEFEPFGWRKTVGNPNLGDVTTPGVQGIGEVRSSVFKGPDAATVVYTLGRKAWYGKVYRLAGIPGWVQSSAKLSVPVGTTPSSSRGAPDRVSVFVYDGAGKLLSASGDRHDDPLGG